MTHTVNFNKMCIWGKTDNESNQFKNNSRFDLIINLLNKRVEFELKFKFVK
jgi:hypothetical protein